MSFDDLAFWHWFALAAIFIIIEIIIDIFIIYIFIYFNSCFEGLPVPLGLRNNDWGLQSSLLQQ